MGAVVEHRGPDDDGTYTERNVAFGMRRLSIIDLAGGHQPISNEDGTVWVVCNGEIYNYRELRTQLEERGHSFRTRSDTEVLVHLYEDYGVKLVGLLRGMFAFALWDKARSRMILARDRLGKKPLYIRKEAKRLLFASEIKSILQDSSIPRNIDVKALKEYLALGYVPAPRTLLEGIEKLLPGHFIVIEEGRIQECEYWDAQFGAIDAYSEEEWEHLIRDKLQEAVRIRMVSDVPLGAFLSGGIDSSAIVAAMARLTSQPVKTYSIGFEGEDAYYNELPYARVVAQKYGTDHHEIIVRPNVADLLPKLIWYMDEPMADSAFITTYLVAKLAREEVTVILSGIGGDELFGGYRRYLGESLRSYYMKLPSAVRARWLPWLMNKLPQDRHSRWKNYIRYGTAFVNSADQTPSERYLSYTTVFTPTAISSLLQPDVLLSDGLGTHTQANVMAEYLAKCGETDELGQAIYLDLKTSLPDDLLLLTDKMTMAASVECRAPFLDHELVELAARMPSHLKVHGLSMKYLLKKALKPWLPREILRRPKRGFGAPIGAWLRRDLDILVQETLSEPQVKQRGLFKWEAVRALIASHNATQKDCSDHLLALITFELWCRLFLDSQGSRPNFPVQTPLH
jgi:asparagine synthase (glutamine-hydrolysing)